LDARTRGIDVRAVTMWSLFGAFDWNSLVVRDDNVYEVGAFDVRSTPPRATALATLGRDLATGSSPIPLALQPGWWERERHITQRSSVVFGTAVSDPPILIVGGTGTLGSALAHACDARGLRAVAVPRQQLDITSRDDIHRVIRRWRPWAVINAAGYVRVDDAELHRDSCWRLNTVAAAQLASEAATHGARYVTLSTDLVFDGQQSRPYVESDIANPLNAYGESKRTAEEWVQACVNDALIVRSAAFFGPADRHNFLACTLREVSAGREVLAAEDIVGSPTYVPYLADAILDLLIDGERGVWHLVNRGCVSWADFAKRVAEAAHLDSTLVRPVPLAALHVRARRPAFSALASERGSVMATLDDAIHEYVSRAGSLWRERRLRPRNAAGGR
jgi:dTDP-4-dehydrorhamnose reductase